MSVAASASRRRRADRYVLAAIPFVPEILAVALYISCHESRGKPARTSCCDRPRPLAASSFRAHVADVRMAASSYCHWMALPIIFSSKRRTQASPSACVEPNSSATANLEPPALNVLGISSTGANHQQDSGRTRMAHLAGPLSVCAFRNRAGAKLVPASPASGPWSSHRGRLANMQYGRLDDRWILGQFGARVGSSS